MLASLSVDGLDLSTLRHRVGIESPNNTVDEAGDWTNDPVTGWTSLRTVYAEVNWISGAESERVLARYADARYTVTFRYQPDLPVSDSYRLNWNGKLLEILGIDDVEGLQRANVAYCREWQA